jgi:hypothetical protein
MLFCNKTKLNPFKGNENLFWLMQISLLKDYLLSDGLEKNCKKKSY